MAYVINEPCIGTKDNSCVEVCPVDCIHPTPDEPDYDKEEMLYIDPEECIDCDACVEACPVDRHNTPSTALTLAACIRGLASRDVHRPQGLATVFGGDGLPRGTVWPPRNLMLILPPRRTCLPLA